MSMTTITGELTFGYTSPGGSERHADFEIGRRPTGGDLMRIGDEPESARNTQFNLMLLQAAVTKFGAMPLPVPLTTLLALNSVDREDLNRAYTKFLKESAGGRRAARLTESRLRLAHGFEVDGQTYDVVEFSNLLTGYDELEADEMTGWRQVCFLLGRQVGALSQSEGAAVLPGPLAPEAFERLDAEDVYEMSSFAAQWRDSFRAKKRAEVQSNGRTGGGVPAAPLPRDDRAGGAEPEPRA